MSDEKGFGGEGVLEISSNFTFTISKTYRLNIDIGPGDLVDETTLSHIWVTTDKKCSGVGVDSR